MNGGVIKELDEDYWQLVVNTDGKITEQYYEAEDNSFKEKNKGLRNIGYYHIWHGCHIWKFLDNSLESHAFSYQEQCRLGAWGYVMTELIAPDKLGMYDDAMKKHGHFPKYIEEFKKYHAGILEQFNPKTKH